jgi:hypothetical protein
MKNITKKLDLFADVVGTTMDETVQPPLVRHKDTLIRHKSKKNTKKYCKGKTGVSHFWSEWLPMFPELPFSRMKERKCLSCGKKGYDYIKKGELNEKTDTITDVNKRMLSL